MTFSSRFIIITTLLSLWLVITAWLFFAFLSRSPKQSLTSAPASISSPTSPISPQALISVTPAANIPTNRKNFLINYTPENYQVFLRFAQPNDRLLFFRTQVLNNKKGSAWPDPARELATGQVLTAWPSWEIAQQHTATWAPYTDIFAYDVETDSGPEAENLSVTISAIRSELNKLSDQYNHPIKLSCGLNRNYGSRHITELSACDDVHIHANEFLRSYPQPDPKSQQDYVQWAVSQAKAIRQINPEVGIWFASLLGGISTDTAIEVAGKITSQMAAANLDFSGFTAWSDPASIQIFLNDLLSL